MKKKSSRPIGSPPINRKLPRRNWKTLWSRMPPWGKITTVTAVVVGLTGAIQGIKAAWPLMRLILPALILYVDGSVDDARGEWRTAQSSDRGVLRDVQIDMNNRSRRDEIQKKYNFAIERTKTSDPTTLQIIDRSLRDVEENISELDNQLNTLKQLKAHGK